MRDLLRGSWLAEWLDLEPQGTQLPVICAVLCGAKRAADIWISRGRVSRFRSLAVKWGLFWHFDPDFDRFDEGEISASRGQFATTRAAIARENNGRTEAHVFIAKSPELLDVTIAAGWYPLVIDKQVVEKSVADHVRFGRALGYPECCIAFFRNRNNWLYDNTPYAAYCNTNGRVDRLSNGLPRHTAFALIAHMPCSFGCRESMKQAQAVLNFITAQVPSYAKEILHRSALPMLSLSELRLFSFNGSKVSPNRIEYRHVEPLNPTTQHDVLLQLLRRGNVCTVDGSLLTIERGGVFKSSYLARGDRYGPECPFVIQSN